MVNQEVLTQMKDLERHISTLSQWTELMRMLTRLFKERLQDGTCRPDDFEFTFEKLLSAIEEHDITPIGDSIKPVLASLTSLCQYDEFLLDVQQSAICEGGALSGLIEKDGAFSPELLSSLLDNT